MLMVRDDAGVVERKGVGNNIYQTLLGFAGSLGRFGKRLSYSKGLYEYLLVVSLAVGSSAIDS